MILIQDKNDPELLGVIEKKSDFIELDRMIKNMNQDLIDSGFEQYQYKAEKVGKKAYIRKI